VNRHAVASYRPVSIARAVVKRRDGSVDVFYSVERVPWWQFRRRMKASRHLRFMRAEDRKAGYGD